MSRLTALALALASLTSLDPPSAAAAEPRLRFEETADAGVMLAGRLLPDTRITSVEVRSLGGGPALRLVGARRDAPIIGEAALPGVSHDLRHATSTARAADRHHFARLRVQDAWPGIDVVYREAGGLLEHDFIVAPGASARRIRVAFPGASGLSLGADGSLVAHGAEGSLTLHAPLAWQEGASGREPVACAWRLRGARATFAIGEHDAARELVIDPTIAWSTYVGGEREAQVTAVAPRPDGSVIALLDARDLPTTPGAMLAQDEGSVVALTCLSPDGSMMLWSTYVASHGAAALSVQADGAVLILGSGDDASLPVIGGMPLSGELDAYLSVVSADGSRLLASGFAGGPGPDGCRSLARAPNGDIVVGCDTWVPGPPGATIIGAASEGTHLLVMRVSSDLSSLLQSTIIGGAEGNQPCSVAVSPIDGSIVVAMNAHVTDDGLPVQNAFQPTRAPTGPACVGPTNQDGYLARLSPDGSQLIFGTYLGGGCADELAAVGVDAAGEIIATGRTFSDDFPTLGAPQAMRAGAGDCFVSRFSTGGELLASTYLGGDHTEKPQSLGFDEGGRVLVVGYTDSPGYPRVNASGLPPGAMDSGPVLAFVSRFDIDGSLEFSTTLGGMTSIRGAGGIITSPWTVAGADGAILFGGHTNTADYPTTPGSLLDVVPYVDAPPGPMPVTGFITSIAGTVSNLTEVSPVSSNPDVAPLTIREVGPMLVLGWEETTGNDLDDDAHVVVYAGTLSSLHAGRYDHAPTTPCSFLAPPATIELPEGDVYFLAARAKDDESSLGTDSFGRERPHPRSPCP